MRMLKAGTLLLALTLGAAVHQVSAQGPGKRQIYSETADPKAAIAAGLAQAKREHKRVIIDFGGDWCGDCQVLDIYFHQKPNIDLLNQNFVLVHVFVREALDNNIDLAAKYGVPLAKGVPALTILDSTGKVLYSQKTGPVQRHAPHGSRFGQRLPEPVEGLSSGPQRIAPMVLAPKPFRSLVLSGQIGAALHRGAETIFRPDDAARLSQPRAVGLVFRDGRALSGVDRRGRNHYAAARSEPAEDRGGRVLRPGLAGQRLSRPERVLHQHQGRRSAAQRARPGDCRDRQRDRRFKRDREPDGRAAPRRGRAGPGAGRSGTSASAPCCWCPLSLIPLAVASVLVMFGRLIAEWIAANLASSVQPVFFGAAMAVRWAISLGGVVALTALIYHLGVPRSEAIAARMSWTRTLPGAVLATLLWFVSTLLFGWYVTRIANYNAVYGSLGAGIALLAWLDLVFLSVLCGAEFNRQLSIDV